MPSSFFSASDSLWTRISSASLYAAASPAGPAPTMTTSTSRVSRSIPGSSAIAYSLLSQKCRAHSNGAQRAERRGQKRKARGFCALRSALCAPVILRPRDDRVLRATDSPVHLQCVDVVRGNGCREARRAAHRPGRCAGRPQTAWHCHASARRDRDHLRLRLPAAAPRGEPAGGGPGLEKPLLPLRCPRQRRTSHRPRRLRRPPRHQRTEEVRHPVRGGGDSGDVRVFVRGGLHRRPELPPRLARRDGLDSLDRRRDERDELHRRHGLAGDRRVADDRGRRSPSSPCCAPTTSRSWS